jgi:hypothetical protein
MAVWKMQVAILFITAVIEVLLIACCYICSSGNKYRRK